MSMQDPCNPNGASGPAIAAGGGDGGSVVPFPTGAGARAFLPRQAGGERRRNELLVLLALLGLLLWAAYEGPG
jgi:hypothetical protein